MNLTLLPVADLNSSVCFVQKMPLEKEFSLVSLRKEPQLFVPEPFPLDICFCCYNQEYDFLGKRWCGQIPSVHTSYRNDQRKQYDTENSLQSIRGALNDKYII